MTVSRLRPFGETIFATMTQLANEHGAINLGQGFPDTDGPARMLEIAREEIAAGNNQYAPALGVPALREAIAARRGVNVSSVLVTVGATEAITATILGLVEPGQEVIVLEPFYDAYAAAIALADATRVPVPLRRTGNTWDLDVDAIAAAMTPRTAMVVVNTPHNPTGSVLSAEALSRLAELCVSRDVLVLADEVYEDLVFPGYAHTRVAELPGMASRTITVSSAAKSFNATGWKTGWAIAPPALLDGVIKAKQFMSFVGATPFQPAVAHALNHEAEWVTDMVAGLARNRDVLSAALRAAGYDVFDSCGTYYVVADVHEDAASFCTRLPAEAGVAAIPISAFVDNPAGWETLVRFAVCKRPEVIDEAAQRIQSFAARS